MTERDPWHFLWHLVNDQLTRQHPDYDATAIADDILDAGWRPPAQIISTREDLDALGFPCVIREIPGKDEIEFYPQLWEKPFQTDGWCRAGAMWRENDCTPTLPVEVLVEPEANRG